MFKRKKITDERIINTQNKIYRECYTLTMIICFGSIIWKLIQGKSGPDFGFELIVIIGVSIYFSIRSVMLGVFSEEAEKREGKRKMKGDLFTGIACVGIGLILGIYFGLYSAINYASSTVEGIKYFIITFLATSLFYSPILFIVFVVPYIVAKKKSEQINRKMLEELEDELE